MCRCNQFRNAKHNFAYISWYSCYFILLFDKFIHRLISKKNKSLKVHFNKVWIFNKLRSLRPSLISFILIKPQKRFLVKLPLSGVIQNLERLAVKLSKKIESFIFSHDSSKVVWKRRICDIYAKVAHLQILRGRKKLSFMFVYVNLIQKESTEVKYTQKFCNIFWMMLFCA